ncbi:MAG: hypothetical protein AB7H80_15695 [Candidatus Kapaibacterium sp.]
MKFNRLFFLAILPAIILFSVPLRAQIESKDVNLDQVDKFFVAIKNAKGETLASTLQNWVLLQEAFRMIAIVNEDSATAAKRKWQADYVGGFGFKIVGLYDLAITMQRRCVENAKGKKQVKDGTMDLAASLELVGEFRESINVWHEGMEKAKDRSLMSLNNLSLVLLKGGEYEECINTVNQLPLNKDYAHARLFSARAYAYSGRYSEAAEELRKACENGECEVYKKLGATRDTAAFWHRDSLERVSAWQPSNRFDASRTLPTEVMTGTFGEGTEVSEFMVSWWFGEIYPLFTSASEYTELGIPSTLDSARLGFVSIGGVPIFTLLYPTNINEAQVTDSVQAFLRKMEGPSAWSREMPVNNRALLTTTTDGQTLVTILHIDWQEEMIRERGKGVSWKNVERR